MRKKINIKIYLFISFCMNISTNYIKCPLCNNIFLKPHINIHYQVCQKNHEERKNIIKQNNVINNQPKKNNLFQYKSPITKNYRKEPEYNGSSSIFSRVNEEKYRKEPSRLDYLEKKQYKILLKNNNVENDIVQEIKELKSKDKNNEQLKQEQLKQEQFKQKQLKQEQLKQEQFKQEQLKQKQLKQEQLKKEQLKQEQIKQEQLKQEQLKQEQLKQNNLKNNSNNNDQYKEKSNTLNITQYIPPNVVSYNDNVLNHFFKQYEKLFVQYISNKCIALVGPAESIIGTGKGHVIDQFDLVVRLNKSIPLPTKIKDDIGTKADIIYNSMNTTDFPGENNLSPQLYKKYGVNFVCTSYPFNHNVFHDDIAQYVYRYKFELPLKVFDDLKFKNFEKMLGTRPYTGTCAIMDLLSYPIKYLYITGLDFYQTKYYSEYRRISKEGLKYNKNSTIHKAKPQLDYLKNVALVDNRVILDGFLDRLLFHDYYKVLKNLKSFDVKNIFNFGDNVFEKYFEMKCSYCTFTKMQYNINKNSNDYPYLIITDNKNYNKKDNEYCLFLTNEKNTLTILNNNLESKKYIGNFFYTKSNFNEPSIFITDKFLMHLKSTLSRISINNCNINLAILLSIILYLPDKHYFSYNEILNTWKITTAEKKFVLFLIKKNILNSKL